MDLPTAVSSDIPTRCTAPSSSAGEEAGEPPQYLCAKWLKERRPALDDHLAELRMT